MCDAAIERSVRRGFVDYGVSARTCWPEPEGLELIASSRTDTQETP